MDWMGEFGDQAWRMWLYLTTGRVLATIFGFGFAVLAIVLFFASRTKWGQAKPLTKCLFLSVLLHVWLLMYAVGTPKILPQGNLSSPDQNISVSFENSLGAERAATDAVPPRNAQQEQALAEFSVDANAEEETSVEEPTELSPWEAPVPLAELAIPPDLGEQTQAVLAAINPMSNLMELSDALAPELLPSLEPTPMPALPPPEEIVNVAEPAATSTDSASYDSSSQVASPEAFPDIQEDHSYAQTQDSSQPVLPTASQNPVTQFAPRNKIFPVASSDAPVQNSAQRAMATSALPREYSLRQAPNRLQLSSAYGADADSEAAVKAGLQWLAQAQTNDGSWNARQYGAGEERNVLGLSRGGTGDKADTGVSGLALLAFLSAGHTHLEGDFQATVRGGLEYLLEAQMPSGDLSGPKQVGNSQNVLNARMYSHSIASLALAEAYAMTLDSGLRQSLMLAAQYSLNAQDIRGGGWRYTPGAPGDLSQFGWQAMMLKSVERSGIKIPVEVQRRMRRFLDSCVAGPRGGLATYRPREGRPSDTMTAEALACRLMLNYPLSVAAQREATELIMANRPGTGEKNVYFWYYATIALFQLQDANWRTWNQAMKQELIRSQVAAYGVEPGSWEPDGLWAGYGGRVYSTAMACLCLEVYYRYLPMYQKQNLAQTQRWSAERR